MPGPRQQVLCHLRETKGANNRCTHFQYTGSHTTGCFCLGADGFQETSCLPHTARHTCAYLPQVGFSGFLTACALLRVLQFYCPRASWEHTLHTYTHTHLSTVHSHHMVACTLFFFFFAGLAHFRNTRCCLRGRVNVITTPYHSLTSVAAGLRTMRPVFVAVAGKPARVRIPRMRARCCTAARLPPAGPQTSWLLNINIVAHCKFQDLSSLHLRLAFAHGVAPGIQGCCALRHSRGMAWSPSRMVDGATRLIVVFTGPPAVG